MTHSTALRRALAFGAALLLLSAAAHAQLFRAYLASNGSDANPCTLLAPCRLLPAALNAVADGGEIWMLDSANYNNAQVDVTKSVTILAVPGALGSVVAASFNALTISGPGLKVALRNLVIGPLPGGGGNHGVVMSFGAELVIENCLIANLPGWGVFVNYPVSVHVTDSTIRDNAFQGLHFSGGARAVVTRSTISGNSLGGVAVFDGDSKTVVDIADSTFSGNSGGGVWLRSTQSFGTISVSVHGSRIYQSGDAVAASSDAGAAVTLSVTDNMIMDNGIGIGSDGAGAKVFASGNTVVGHGFGMRTFGAGIIETAGNNALRNNTTDTSGNITAVAPKRGARP